MDKVERAIGATLSLGAAVLLVAGCGSIPAPVGQKSSAPTESKTVAPTSAKPEAESYARWPKGNAHRNLTTIFSGCDADAAYVRNLDKDAEIFDTASGRYIDLPKPTLDPADELLDYACTIANTENGGLRAIHFVYTKTPSHGLTAESKQAKLYSFDVSKPGAPVVKDFPLNPEEHWSFRPGMSTFSVLQDNHLAFFDASTLDRSSPW
jgi:hypothetical protein